MEPPTIEICPLNMILSSSTFTPRGATTLGRRVGVSHHHPSRPSIDRPVEVFQINPSEMAKNDTLVRVENEYDRLALGTPYSINTILKVIEFFTHSPFLF